jgi:hypothetical protein
MSNLKKTNCPYCSKSVGVIRGVTIAKHRLSKQDHTICPGSACNMHFKYRKVRVRATVIGSRLIDYTTLFLKTYTENRGIMMGKASTELIQKYPKDKDSICDIKVELV